LKWLARGDGAVDRAGNARAKVVGAADHRQHLAGVGVHHHDGPVAHVARRLARPRVGQLRQPVADETLGRVLCIQVQRGVDLQPLGVNPLQAKFSLQLAAHEHHKMGRFDGERNRGQAQVLLRCQVGLLLRDGAVLDHQSQYNALPAPGGLGILQRVVADWRLRQPGQQGALGQVEFGGAFGKVGTGGGFDTVGQVAIVGLVQVKCENLVLAVGACQAPGQDGLAQLALPTQVDPQRTGDGPPVHARVAVEAGVFGGDGGVYAGRGHLGQRDGGVRAAMRVENLVQQPSVPVVDARGWGGGPLIQPIGRR